MNQRSNSAERSARVRLLASAIADGRDPSEAAEKLCASWGLVDRRMRRRYCSAALALLGRSRRFNRSQLSAAAVAVRRMLLASAIAAGDLAAANTAQSAIEKLQGLDAAATERIETTMRGLTEGWFAVFMDALKTHVGDPIQRDRVLDHFQMRLRERMPESAWN